MSADKKTVAQKFIKNPNDVVAMSRKRMQAMEMIATKIIAPDDAKQKKNSAIFKEILARELNPHQSRNISKKEMLADDEIFVCEKNDKISLGRMKKMAQFMDHLNKRYDVEERTSLNSNEDSVDSHSSASSGNSDRKLKKSAKAIGSVENLIANAMTLLKYRVITLIQKKKYSNYCTRVNTFYVSPISNLIIAHWKKKILSFHFCGRKIASLN